VDVRERVFLNIDADVGRCGGEERLLLVRAAADVEYALAGRARAFNAKPFGEWTAHRPAGIGLARAPLTLAGRHGGEA